MARRGESWWTDHTIDLEALRAALGRPDAAQWLDPVDLACAALLLRARASIALKDAVAVLREAGVPARVVGTLTLARVDAAHEGDGLAIWEDRIVGREGQAVVWRARTILARARTQAAMARAEARLRGEAAPSKPAAVVKAEPAAKARALTHSSTSNEPSAVLPSPPPRVDAPLAITSLDAAFMARLVAGSPAGLDALARTLSAHRIAAAQSYDELLCLSTLRGVDHHGYQVEAVRRVFRQLRGRALLADEVGLGKTVEAMMVLREYQLRGMVRRALVICPNALVAQWAGELADKAGVTPRTTEQAAFRQDPERFWQDEGVVVASLAAARTARNAPLVQARPWDLVVVDEAHHVKNRSTLGWKLVDGLEARFLLLLTATPVENDLEELYALVTLLRPGQFATPADFRKQFVDRKNPTSPRNRERLRRLLSDVMIRNTRAQSGLKLPPRFVTTVAVDPLPEEQALYEATVALLRAHAHDGAARRAASMLLLEAGSSPRALASTLGRMTDKARGDAFAEGLAALEPIARRVTETRKTEALLSIARSHDEAVLVFTRYRETAEHVSEALGRAGIRHRALRGGMSAEERQQAIDSFRATGGVLVATSVGSEGQNLQFCRVLVNFDLPWNPMVIEQRIGRLHRMGQEREVRVYNLCARGTVEERVLGVLGDRLHLFELVVGEMDMVLGNLADERDLEERILELYASAEDEAAIDRGFDAITEELRAARTRYDRTKAFDEALFGEDYET